VASEGDEGSDWRDKQAIQELIHLYSDAVNRRDWAQFEAVWAPNAVWEVAEPTNMRKEGRVAICDAAHEILDAADFIIQMAHCSVVTLLGGGRATATSTMQEIGRTQGAPGFMAFGIYYDELIKGESGWRFSFRRFQPVYMNSDPLSGQIITPDQSS
jgi:hypothetical protein